VRFLSTEDVSATLLENEGWMGRFRIGAKRVYVKQCSTYSNTGYPDWVLAEAQIMSGGGNQK
jgi:hypothetical protein